MPNFDNFIDNIKEFRYEKVNFDNLDFIQIIEDTELFSLREKLALIQLITGTRANLDIITKSKNIYDEKRDIYTVNQPDIENTEQVLIKLPFKYQKHRSFYWSNHFKKYKESIWFQVVTSNYMLEFLSNYEKQLSHAERGIFYGYPTTTIMAYYNALERYPFMDFEHSQHYSTATKYIGAGIYSKQFFEQEKAYYEVIWEQIKKLSPKLVEQAEIEWEQEKEEEKQKLIKTTSDKLTV